MFDMLPLPLFCLNFKAKIKKIRLYFVSTTSDSNELHFGSFRLLANANGLLVNVFRLEKYVS